MVQGHGSPHAEPFRETEPLPDDTDAEDVTRAFDIDPAGEKRGSGDHVETPSKEDVDTLMEDDDA